MSDIAELTLMFLRKLQPTCSHPIWHGDKSNEVILNANWQVLLSIIPGAYVQQSLANPELVNPELSFIQNLP